MFTEEIISKMSTLLTASKIAFLKIYTSFMGRKLNCWLFYEVIKKIYEAFSLPVN